MPAPLPQKGSITHTGSHIYALLLPMLCLVCGCGDFFSRESTKVQNEQIFRSLSQVEIVPDVNKPLASLYTAEPTILPVKSGVTLFYFTRHHPPTTLASLVRAQLVDRQPQPGRQESQ